MEKELIDPLVVTAERSTKPRELEEDDRDMETGIPMKGKKHKEIEVGLTEFPEGQDRTKGEGKGYEIPFAEMDDNYLKTRTPDPNVKFMPIQRATVDMINRMINDKDYDPGDEFATTRGMIDEMVDGGRGTVDPEKKRKKAESSVKLSGDKVASILGSYIATVGGLVTSGSTITVADVDMVTQTVAFREGVPPETVQYVVQRFRTAQKPTTQKSWPSMYDLPEYAPPAPPEIEQAYSEVDQMRQRLAELDAVMAEMKKKFDAEIKAYKTEQKYDELTKQTVTKWGTVKTLLTAVQGKVVKIADKLLAVIQKKERNPWPDPTKFKEALQVKFPQLAEQIEDTFEKARSYMDVDKFYEITEPPKQLMQRTTPPTPTAGLLIDAEAIDPLDDLIDSLTDLSRELGGLEGEMGIV